MELFVALGAIALLVGAIGIANVMVIAVLERRSEIGLRRALGAKRGHIRWQFLAEAFRCRRPEGSRRRGGCIHGRDMGPLSGLAGDRSARGNRWRNLRGDRGRSPRGYLSGASRRGAATYGCLEKLYVERMPCAR